MASTPSLALVRQEDCCNLDLVAAVPVPFSNCAPGDAQQTDVASPEPPGKSRHLHQKIEHYNIPKRFIQSTNRFICVLNTCRTSALNGFEFFTVAFLRSNCPGVAANDTFFLHIRIN
jgi:hypothetical protein